MFLYLDKDCNKIAVVAPHARTPEISAYVPNLNYVDWWDRLKALPDPEKCKNTSSSWKRLADANLSPSQPPVNCNDRVPGVEKTSQQERFCPAACDPNEDKTPTLDQERLTTSCRIPVEDVQFLVVLNVGFEPTIILKGDSANEASPTSVPARWLARKPGQGGACSPVTPTPCRLPKIAQLVGSPATCLCLNPPP